MSNRKKNNATANNDTPVTNDTPVVSSADEPKQLKMTQANGEEYAIDMNLTFKESTKQSTATATVMAVGEMLQAYNGVTKGYFTMVSKLAVIIGNGYYKEITGIKTPNEFMTKIIGVSKSHASEMIKVARAFYTSLGNLKNEALGLFSYSELVLLADKDESIIQDVIDRITELGSHTRADVKNAIESATNRALGVEEESTEESTEESKTDNASSADEPQVDTINYRNLIKTWYESLKRINELKDDSERESEIYNLLCEVASVVTDME